MMVVASLNNAAFGAGYQIRDSRIADGRWREVFNSDSSHYGGSNLGNGLGLAASHEPYGTQPCTLTLTLPPLGAVILQPA